MECYVQNATLKPSLGEPEPNTLTLTDRQRVSAVLQQKAVFKMWL